MSKDYVYNSLAVCVQGLVHIEYDSPLTVMYASSGMVGTVLITKVGLGAVSQNFFTRAVLSSLMIAMAPAQARDNAVGTGTWYPVPYNAKFMTGDSWQYETVTYRLWGVQSCLRGTKFVNSYNKERDCGEASLVVLVSMIKDLKPVCSTVTEDVPQRTRFVVCLSTIQSGPAKGQRIDLATGLITQGYAFAAHTADGGLVHLPYGVAEEQARDRKAGLWQFDFPNPNAIIARTLNGSPAPTLQRPTSPKP